MLLQVIDARRRQIHYFEVEDIYAGLVKNMNGHHENSKDVDEKELTLLKSMVMNKDQVDVKPEFGHRVAGPWRQTDIMTFWLGDWKDQEPPATGKPGVATPPKP